MHFAKTDRI